MESKFLDRNFSSIKRLNPSLNLEADLGTLSHWKIFKSFKKLDLRFYKTQINFSNKFLPFIWNRSNSILVKPVAHVIWNRKIKFVVAWLVEIWLKLLVPNFIQDYSALSRILKLVLRFCRLRTDSDLLVILEKNLSLESEIRI